MKRHIPALLVFCLGLAFYVALLPRSVLPGDSGELIAASRTLSIAHPPGYPLYLMVGKILSSVLAFGSIAYRYNLISAIVASAMLAVLYIILTAMRVRRLPAMAVTLGLGALGSVWLQATAAEVYALNALFTALMLYIAVSSRRYGVGRLLLLGFVGGLSISHHLTMVYPLLCALGIMVLGLGLRPGAKAVVLSVLLLVLGLSVWLYIPIRAGVGPPLMWGRTDTLEGFLSHITAQDYQFRLRQFDLFERAGDFLESMRLIAGQAGAVFVSAALFGLFAGRVRLSIRLSLAALVVLFGVHSAMYDIPDIESHLLPSLLGIGVLAGLGVQRLVDLARRLGRRASQAAVAVTFLIVVPSLVSVHPRADEWFAHDYAEAIQQSAREACGDNCIVITNGDLSSFPLFYVSLVEPGGVLMFDVFSSNPALIGAEEYTEDLDECVSRAASVYGDSAIALLGPLPPYVVGVQPQICGMIYLLHLPREQCRPPYEHRVRGVALDLREYSSRLLSASYYLHLARWSGQEKDTAAVGANVEKALAAVGDDAGTYINAVRIFGQYGMARDAFAAARAAVEADPDFFGAHNLLGGMLAGAGRTNEAIVEYREALEGNPSPAGVYSNLGNAYISIRDYGSALESFRTAIELDSTLVSAHIGMGLTYQAMGDQERALSLFRHARSVDPYAQPAYHVEATLLLAMGRNEAAAGLAREGLRKWPDSALMLSDLGLSFLRTDALDSAIVYLAEAVERDASMLNARGNLAVALERKGFRARAMEQYRIYLETAPIGDSRDMAARAIERLTRPNE